MQKNNLPGYLHFLTSSGLLIGSLLNLLLAILIFFGLQWGPGRLDIYRRFRGINLLDLLLTLLLLCTCLLFFRARQRLLQEQGRGLSLFRIGLLIAMLSLFFYCAGLCLLMHTNIFLIPGLIDLIAGILLFLVHRSVFKRYCKQFHK